LLSLIETELMRLIIVQQEQGVTPLKRYALFLFLPYRSAVWLFLRLTHHRYKDSCLELFTGLIQGKPMFLNNILD
jgi:hypothetical protein